MRPHIKKEIVPCSGHNLSSCNFSLGGVRGIDLGRTLLLRRVPCKPAFDKSAVMRSLIVLSYIYLKASLDRYIKQQKTPSSVSFISLGLRSEGDSNPRAACDDYTLSRLSILTRNRLSYTILLIISFLLSRNLRT